MPQILAGPKNPQENQQGSTTYNYLREKIENGGQNYESST